MTSKFKIFRKLDGTLEFFVYGVSVGHDDPAALHWAERQTPEQLFRNTAFQLDEKVDEYREHE